MGANILKKIQRVVIYAKSSTMNPCTTSRSTQIILKYIHINVNHIHIFDEGHKAVPQLPLFWKHKFSMLNGY